MSGLVWSGLVVVPSDTLWPKQKMVESSCLPATRPKKKKNKNAQKLWHACWAIVKKHWSRGRIKEGGAGGILYLSDSQRGRHSICHFYEALGSELKTAHEIFHLYSYSVLIFMSRGKQSSKRLDWGLRIGEDQHEVLGELR